jgi:hypothetical protein
MEVNEVLCLGSKVGKTGECRMDIRLRGERLSEGFLREQLSKGDTPYLEAGTLEELASRLEVVIFESRIHEGLVLIDYLIEVEEQVCDQGPCRQLA